MLDHILVQLTVVHAIHTVLLTAPAVVHGMLAA